MQDPIAARRLRDGIDDSIPSYDPVDLPAPHRGVWTAGDQSGHSGAPMGRSRRAAAMAAHEDRHSGGSANGGGMGGTKFRCRSWRYAG